MLLLLSLVLAQAALILPTFEPGSELRFVSPDLLTVYASGSVSEERELRIDLPLAAGTELRLVIFPPDADDAAKAEALAPANRHLGRVADDRNDIDVRFAGSEGSLSLRSFLQEEHGVRLILVTKR
jgi:hypothetical protein